ncbi:MAG: hypothetical protein IJZ81_01195 [Clostridia bacterium]|nr:hypothetical protein [Clostridia bacterium]
MANYLTTQKAFRVLLNSARSGSVAQGYIFEGMKGVGKYTAARIFANAIHCTGEVKPCGECPHCKKHAVNTHSDLIIIGGSGQIKVDDIRSMNEQLYIKPALSEKKICIIRNADNMNQDAQNALLKSFEEPPSYAVIILLSENTKNLLATIRSRGRKVIFEPFSESEIKEYILRQYPLKRDIIPFIALYSGGVIGRAIDLCENEEFFETRKRMFEAIALMTGERLSIFTVADVFGVKNGKSGFGNCDLYFELFTSFMRDIMAIKTGARIINQDMAELLGAFSSKVTLSAILSIIERTANVRSQLNVSMKYELWIVNMLINCWEDIHGKGSRS